MVAIRVNGGTAGVKAAVSAGATVTATLDSTDGVRQTAWTVYSTDETTATTDYTLTQSGSVGQNISFTAGIEGTALILQAVINAGIDQETGLASVTATRARVKVYVPLADGGEVGCVGEEFESDATFGSTGIVNAGIRKAALLSPSGVPVKIVRLATAAALPSNTRSGNVLTATANGALGTVGGATAASGDRILVQNEGGGASHVNNGCYRVSQIGDGSTPWQLTRTTDFDDSAELIAMTTFRVQEGTYAGKEFYLVTSGATINVTALEFASFAYAPNDAAYLCVGSSGLLSAEVNVSSLSSTVTFTSTSITPLGASRTSSTTNNVVDVAEVTALSSGTATAGFGPTIKFLGEVSGGGAENYGRLGFTATDLTGTSEDTQAVVQCRTGGAALATIARISGTEVYLEALADGVGGVVNVDGAGVLSVAPGGSGADANAYYLENAGTAVNTNGVPIQALASTLTFTSSAAVPLASARTDSATNTVVDVEQSSVNTSGTAATNFGIGKLWKAENASGGSAVDIGRELWRWTNATALSATSQWGIQLRNNGDGLASLQMYLDGDGDLTVLQHVYSEGFYGGFLDAASAASLLIGDTNATDITIAQVGVPVTVADTLTVASTITTTDGSITANKPSGGATDVEGVRLINDTATTGGTTEQRPPHLYWKGHGRNTSGGGSDVPVELRIRPVLTAAASNPTVEMYFQRQLNSGGWLTYMYLTSSIPGFGGAGVYTQNTIFLASPSNGLRIDQGGSAYGGIKASSGNIVVEAQGSGNRAEVWGAIATGTNGDGIRLWNTAGTRTNGNLVSVGDGGSYTQKWAVQYDGATITPRVVAAPSLPTSTAAAVTFNLSTSQHVDHVVSENTTVTITGGSRGQQGTLVFIQDATGRTITMPAASSTLKYDTTLSGLGVTAMVDTTASTITLLQYRITNGDIVLIYGRSVIAT